MDKLSHQRGRMAIILPDSGQLRGEMWGKSLLD